MRMAATAVRQRTREVVEAGSDDGEREFLFTGRDFEQVRRLIRERAGIALADGKQDMVYGRLSRRLRALGIGSFQDYLERLEGDATDPEWQEFTNSLTTNLTSFFRESHHFDRLAELMLARRPGERLMLWCAAASTGEEPYSMAMTAVEAFESDAPPVAILATDIDTNVLATAARGVYSQERIEQLSAQRRQRFFQRGTGNNRGLCRVRDHLRVMVTFRPFNLLAQHYPMRGPFDAVFCRNVMIYFDKHTQRQILERIMPLLAADGLFFAGHSETFFHAADLMKSCGRTIYRRAATA